MSNKFTWIIKTSCLRELHCKKSKTQIFHSTTALQIASFISVPRAVFQQLLLDVTVKICLLCLSHL